MHAGGNHIRSKTIILSEGSTFNNFPSILSKRTGKDTSLSIKINNLINMKNCQIIITYIYYIVILKVLLLYVSHVFQLHFRLISEILYIIKESTVC